MKFFYTFLLALCLLSSGGEMVQAQVESTSEPAASAGAQQSFIIANVNLSDVEVFTNDKSISGSFSLSTYGAVQTEIVYGVRVVLDDTVRFVQPLGQVAVLTPGHLQSISFEYGLPIGLAGEMSVDLIAETKTGLPLGFQNIYRATMTGDSFSAIDCVGDMTKSYTCVSPVEQSLSISYYSGSQLDQPVMTESKMLSAGETTFSPMLSGGLYTAVLRGDQGLIVGTATLLTSETFAKIINVYSTFEKPGEVNGAVALETVSGGEMILQLLAVSDTNPSCGSAEVPVSGAATAFTVAVGDCTAGTLEVTLADSNGSVLATSAVTFANYSPAPTPLVLDLSKPSSQGTSLVLYVIAAVGIILLLALILYGRRSHRADSVTDLPKTMVLSLVICFGFTFAPQAFALTLIGSTTGYPDIRDIHRPAHTGTATFSTNQSTYDRGQTVIVSVNLVVWSGLGVTNVGNGTTASLQNARLSYFADSSNNPIWNAYAFQQLNTYLTTGTRTISQGDTYSQSGSTSFTVPTSVPFGYAYIFHRLNLTTTPDIGMLPSQTNRTFDGSQSIQITRNAPAGSCMIGVGGNIGLDECIGYPYSVSYYSISVGGSSVAAHDVSFIGENITACSSPNPVFYYSNLQSLPSCTPQPQNNCLPTTPVTGSGCSGSIISSDNGDPSDPEFMVNGVVPQSSRAFCNTHNASCCAYNVSEVGNSGIYMGNTTASNGLPTGPVNGYTGVISCVPPAVGTVNFSTNNPGANWTITNWTITGPVNFSGSGTTGSFTGRPVGLYTITWGAVSGFTSPLPQSRTLATGGTITFDGTYTAVTPPSVQLNFQ